jgi:hypothetical protein
MIITMSYKYLFCILIAQWSILFSQTIHHWASFAKGSSITSINKNISKHPNIFGNRWPTYIFNVNQSIIYRMEYSKFQRLSFITGVSYNFSSSTFMQPDQIGFGAFPAIFIPRYSIEKVFFQHLDIPIGIRFILGKKSNSIYIIQQLGMGIIVTSSRSVIDLTYNRDFKGRPITKVYDPFKERYEYWDSTNRLIPFIITGFGKRIILGNNNVLLEIHYRNDLRSILYRPWGNPVFPNVKLINHSLYFNFGFIF